MGQNDSDRAQASPPSTLFIYTVTPTEVSTSDNTNNPISLSIGVNNPKTNGFVDCSEIEFAVSIGTTENDLTGDYADMQAQSNQADWAIEKLPYTSSPLIFKVTPA